MLLYTLLISAIGLASTAAAICQTDDDCSLNGICTPPPSPSTTTSTCICDRGWHGPDCGLLDLRPADRWTGYNHTNFTSPDFYTTGRGNSSWGGHILHDRTDPSLFHLITSQMARGCGLPGWRPFSTVIRAESRTGPRGPYTWAQTLFGTFHHNPTTVWSPGEGAWLMYFIGRDVETPTTCRSQKWNNTISVTASTDLRSWSEPKALVVNVTNPAPWPLWSEANQTKAMLLGVEKNNIYYSEAWADVPEIVVEPANRNRSEDPFLWRDRRGHWHFLMHNMIDIEEFNGRKYPRVGGHAFAREWQGPWTYSNTTAFNTSVDFTDGVRTDYYRRERPKLYFDEDMTPLYLINGVQEFNTSASYTLIQPIGDAYKEYEEKLGL